MAFRLVIDIASEGDTEAAVKYLTEDEGRELKSYAKALERIYLGEHLPGQHDRFRAIAINVHEHNGPRDCQHCDMVKNYTLEVLADASAIPDVHNIS